MRATVLLLVLVSGCATNHFGRLPPLSVAEQGAYTCRELELEMAKAKAFVTDIEAQSKGVSGKDVLGFLGDFGIGNSIEYQEATKSGMARLTQLSTLFIAKECAWTISPVATPLGDLPAAVVAPTSAKSPQCVSSHC